MVGHTFHELLSPDSSALSPVELRGRRLTREGDNKSRVGSHKKKEESGRGRQREGGSIIEGRERGREGKEKGNGVKEEGRGRRGGRRGRERGKGVSRGERSKGRGERFPQFTLTVRVLAVPAKSGHCLLKYLLGIGFETGVVVSVGEKTTDGRQVASLEVE